MCVRRHDGGTGRASESETKTSTPRVAQRSAAAAPLKPNNKLTPPNQPKGKLEEGLAYLRGLQDEAFAQLKGGVTYAVAHPEVSYPAGAAAALVLLPGVRRLLYRATLARLRNPEVRECV